MSEGQGNAGTGAAATGSGEAGNAQATAQAQATQSTEAAAESSSEEGLSPAQEAAKLFEAPDIDLSEDKQVVSETIEDKVEETKEVEEPEKKEPEEKEKKVVEDKTEEVVEDKKEPTKKELSDFQKYISEKHKDSTFESDDDYTKKALELFADNDAYITKNKEVNKKLYDVFDGNPEAVKYILGMADGMSSTESLIRSHDMSEVLRSYESIDTSTDPDAAKLKAAKEEGLKKLSDRQAKEQTFNDNAKKSKEVIDAFVKEHDLSKEDSKKFFDDVDGLYAELTNGIVSHNHLTLMRKGLMLDKAVEDAAKDAEIATKNEKIEVLKKKKKEGDKIPRLESAKTEVAEKSTPDYFSDEIDKHNERNTFSKR